MAKTSKRQRELARRRVERQMQRRMEARARARRRATVIAASAGAVAVVVVIVVLAVVLSGGNGKKKNAKLATKPSATPTPSPTALAAPPTKCAPIKPDPPLKGDSYVPPVKGKVSTKLVVNDVKKGHGKAAKKGSTLLVKYVGISCSTGKEFDSTAKDGGKPFPVTLGRGEVIQGWDQGLIGVKAGGERELIIPPSLGYGPNGSGPIKGNEVLIFVVDVLSVK